jgi:hypothetical protein
MKLDLGGIQPLPDGLCEASSEQLAQPEDVNDFWGRLVDLGTREPGILSDIIAQLHNRSNVRAVNRASRYLVNGDTTCVRLAGHCASPTTELGTVFPNADSLHLSTSARHPHLVENLASTSPCFLGRLRALRLDIHESAAVDAACHALLPRCAHGHKMLTDWLGVAFDASCRMRVVLAVASSAHMQTMRAWLTGCTANWQTTCTDTDSVCMLPF